MDTNDEGECSKHPCAPHGFNRNGSHSEDRYVCECENWSPDRNCAGLELLEALKMARAELAGLPRSLGYDFTHLPKIDAVIAKALGHDGYHEDIVQEWLADNPQPAEQQPDATQLVEALPELCDEIDKHEIHAAISNTSISWFKRKARKALAAHRKQGGEA